MKRKTTIKQTGKKDYHVGIKFNVMVSGATRCNEDIFNKLDEIVALRSKNFESLQTVIKSMKALIVSKRFSLLHLYCCYTESKNEVLSTGCFTKSFTLKNQRGGGRVKMSSRLFPAYCYSCDRLQLFH